MYKLRRLGELVLVTVWCVWCLGEPESTASDSGSTTTAVTQPSTSVTSPTPDAKAGDGDVWSGPQKVAEDKSRYAETFYDYLRVTLPNILTVLVILNSLLLKLAALNICILS